MTLETQRDIFGGTAAKIDTTHKHKFVEAPLHYTDRVIYRKICSICKFVSWIK